jgi:D-arabinose 1-dehydrogenase-like Zn-dependent alcohol dehydrogenase
MSDKLSQYRDGLTPLPSTYRLWPLYGAGLDNMGQNGQPIEVPLPSYGPDELLIRHDACGLCYSDIKVIAQGQNHPRIFRDMKTQPIVLGHEVSMTVMGVGKNLRDQYKVGDRLTLETDIVTEGKTLAYGYWFQGGLSQYSVIDKHIIASDLGNNLIHLRPDLGYAECALTEPWACVIASYRLEYRTAIKPGGTLWIIGVGGSQSYSISSGFDETAHPARLLLTNVPDHFAVWLKTRSRQLGVDVIDVPDVAASPVDLVDDIVLLGADPDLVEKVSPRLAIFGILAVLSDKPMSRKVNLDVGRIHYHRWLYLGSADQDIARAYCSVLIQPNLNPGGRAWFVGAGGPMGRMHVQRAINFNNPPATIVCTDVSDLRLDDLCTSFAAEARAKGIEFICLNPTRKEAYAEGMQRFVREGFDNIVMLVSIPAVISDSANYLAENGLMNVFAGVARGTMVSLDYNQFIARNNRVIGHSASAMADMQITLSKTMSGELSPNRSVTAIGSLTATRDGLKAVSDASYPGKVVIYPNIKEMPLTPVAEFKEKFPTVHARLKDGREWTNEAEEEFLKIMLP